MLKKVLSLFVLAIFLAHFAGFYIYFFAQLQIVRQEMRARLEELPAEELELIMLSADEYQKAKVEEHEIEVDGKMYDIARILERKDTVLVYCLHDKAEDNLLAFLDKILSLPLKDKKAPSQLIKFTALTFILPGDVSWKISSVNSTMNFTGYQVISSLYYPALNSPPPWVNI